MRRVIKILAIVAMIVLLAYGGLCVYANCIAPNPGTVEMPGANKAPYAFFVENTGTLILSDNYEQFGEIAGSRTYVLHGYWERVGAEFKRRGSDIILSEQIFGEIKVKRRD